MTSLPGVGPLRWLVEDKYRDLHLCGYSCWCWSLYLFLHTANTDTFFSQDSRRQRTLRAKFKMLILLNKWKNSHKWKTNHDRNNNRVINPLNTKKTEKIKSCSKNWTCDLLHGSGMTYADLGLALLFKLLCKVCMTNWQIIPWILISHEGT